ncbi:MAG TPA: hypothetical protein VFQ24_16645 [Terriglobia bacterium]|nr:hypothetical protein [Terriglobia bacterium]
MPTKTDRILSYLPGTFRALPGPTALYSVVDAYGNELLQAENTLVAVMRSHWVDTADQGEAIIDDLARIASLYGLAPRDDEDVEEFRAHLKRYVRTFLEGTPTVLGILRVAAEALGLVIQDSYNQLDPWWKRDGDTLTTVEPQGDDALDLLFESLVLTAQGSPAQAARIQGMVDLSGKIDLRPSSKLALQIDATPPVILDLVSLVADPAAASVTDLVDAINSKFPSKIAFSRDGKRLLLQSPTAGAGSKVAVQEVASDAAVQLLGLLPRRYRGSDQDSARVVGTVDLAGGVDLSDRRYLRLLIDGSHLAEVDCAGSNPAATTLQQIVDAINGALGINVASHDGHFLKLTSQLTGFASVIQIQSPAAQDATQTLFGPVGGLHLGQSPQPAKATSTADLSQGIDLSHVFNIEVSLDGGPHLLINCAGATSSATTAAEIASAINNAAGKQIATQDGKSVTLASPTQGAASSVEFFKPATADATFAIFGIAVRESLGQPATAARMEGKAIPAGTVNVGALHVLRVALDGGEATTVDFWNGAQDRLAMTLAEVAAAINAALGTGIASSDGQRLALTSATVGASSSVALVPLEHSLTRRFVTRAFFTAEASLKVLGMPEALEAKAYGKTYGTEAAAARVAGNADLSRGVDLRVDPFLQLSIDGGPAMLIDCSLKSPRPRVAMLDEMVEAINTRIDSTGNSRVASHDGRVLYFTSPTRGAASSLEFRPVIAQDVSATLGLQPLNLSGSDATRVTFQGTVDLSAGLDLSAASKVKLAIDGATPVEIDCAGADPAHTSQGEIVTRINAQLNTVVATAVGKMIVLTSPTRGAGSKIEFLTPSGGDATKAIFGIGPRSYHGQAAVAPEATGSKDISGGVDLRLSRFLRLGIDGGALQTIDCAGGAANPAAVTLPEIIAAINKATNKPIASSPDGNRLTLKSPTAGFPGKLAIDFFTSDGAFQRLMRDAPNMTRGNDPAPATITGTVDLLAGADLGERRILRLAVDGGRAADIDISGAKPDQTFLDEIAAKINAVFPGMATAGDGAHLVLNSPTRGELSSLEILPVRVLELVEYPEMPAEQTLSLRHGGNFSIHNPSAADSDLEIEITAPQGVAGAELVNRSTGMRVRVLDAVPSGCTLKLRRDEKSGLRAEIVTAAGKHSSAVGILSGPLGRQVVVPYSGPLRLGGGYQSQASLQLDHPPARNITILRARRSGLEGGSITVAVKPAVLPVPNEVTAADGRAGVVGKLQWKAGGYVLADTNQATIVTLRAGAGIGFASQLDHVVLAQGNIYPGEGGVPLMLVDSLETLFDVTIQGPADDSTAAPESYPCVSIGAGTEQPQSLCRKVFEKPSSQLVVAEELEKSAALRLPRGRSDFTYMAADGARFNHAAFDHARFAGGQCVEQGVFNVSLLSCMPKLKPEVPEAAVFAGGDAAPKVQVTLRWNNHQPGAFFVNLPADLPEKFGACFGQARFGQPGSAPESYTGVVMEPETDEDYIKTRINGKSNLVTASSVPRVPLGWEPMLMPFRHPRARKLTGGTDTDQAAVYLAEPGVPGFIEVKAIQTGTWGNTIEVTARKAAPARFDMTVGYQGARFENARQTVFAGRILASGEDPLPPLTGEMLKPRPAGVLQSKAAGVHARVTRDRAEPKD